MSWTDDDDPPTNDRLSRGEKILGYVGLGLVTLIVLYLVALLLIWLTGKAFS